MISSKLRGIILVTWIFINFTILHIADWPNIKLWKLRGGEFIDLSAIQDYATCFEDIGYSVYNPGPLSDCHGFVYGTTLLRTFNFFGIALIQTQILGMIFLFILSASLALVLAKVSISVRALIPISSLIILSPPISLLAERGNIDVLMFAGIATSLLALSDKHWVMRLAILSFLTLIKFYSIPLLLLFLVKALRKNQILAAVPMFATVFFSIRDLVQVTSLPQPINAAFGNLSLFYYLDWLGVTTSELTGHILGLFAVCACILILAYASSKLPWFFKREVTDYELIASLTLLFCYYLGMNYDYRLVFVLLPIAIAMQHPSGKTTLLNALIVITSILWGSFNLFKWQFFGDVAIGVLVSFYTFLIISKFVSLASERKVTKSTIERKPK